MITVNDNAAKIMPKKRKIVIKDCYIDETSNGLRLTDEDGTDILAEIKSSLPENIDTFGFSITFELDEE